jgi:hypothetical protein
VILVKRWSGTAWEEVGAGSATSYAGITLGPGVYTSPDVALESSGDPIVAYLAWNARRELAVRRFAAGWSEVTFPLSMDTGDPAFSMVVAFDGAALVAMPQPEGMLLLRCDARACAPDAPVLPNDAAVEWVQTSLALDSRGRVLLARPDSSTGNFEIVVDRWNGAAWQRLGNVSNSASESVNPSVASGGGRSCVAWSEPVPGSREIVMRCWDD